jgi:hypothetical protein
VDVLFSVLIENGNVTSVFAFSSDGKHVGYIADQDADEVFELYSVDLATPGISFRLNGALVTDGDVCRFKFSPDSTRVGYGTSRSRPDGTTREPITLTASQPVGSRPNHPSPTVCHVVRGSIKPPQKSSSARTSITPPRRPVDHRCGGRG